MVFGKFFGRQEEEPKPQEKAGQAPQERGKEDSASSHTTLSLERCFESDQVFQDARQIITVNGYSVILRENKIAVVDEHGKTVEDFARKSDITMYVHWGSFYKGGGDSSRVEISELSQYIPHSLAREFSKACEGKNTWEPARGLAGRSVRVPGNLRLSTNEDYLYLSSDGIVFIAFEIQKDGAPLPPRMWKRIDGMIKDRIPAGLGNDMRLVRKAGENSFITLDRIPDGTVTASGDAVTFHSNRDGETTKADYSDPVVGVGTNLCKDRSGSIVSYCRTVKPTELIQIDTKTDPSTWSSAKPLRFPPELQIETIHHLSMDQSGHFFTCVINNTFMILESDTLKPVEIGKAANLTHQTLDAEGNIRGIDEKGKLVMYKTNLHTLGQHIQTRKVAQLATGIKVGALFGTVQGQPNGPAKKASVGMDALDPLRDQYTAEFDTHIQSASSEPNIHALYTARDSLKAELNRQGLRPDQVDYITHEINEKIEAKAQAIADTKVTDMLTRIRTQLAGGVSLRTIGPIGEEISSIGNMQNSISPGLRMQVADLSLDFQRRSQDLFRSASADLQREVDGIVESARNELSRMDRHTQFDQWRDFELPRMKRMLSETARNCPAECTDAMDHITQARLKLQELADSQETKFRDQFEAIRERAATQIKEIGDNLKGEIRGFCERMRARKFTTRDEARTFIETAPAYNELREEIRLLADRDTDLSHELEHSLEVAIANVLYEVERKGTHTIGGDGRQMETFGSKRFPIFEQPVAKRQGKKVELAFDVEERSKGPGMKAENLMGDLAVRITASGGQEQMVRLWEGMQNEDDFRYGGSAKFGKPIQATYMQQGEYRAIRKHYLEWKKPKGLKEQYAELVAGVRDHYALRIQPPRNRGEEDARWKEEHLKLLGKLADFTEKYQVSILQRIELIESADEPEYENVKGLVPEWRNHWVTAPEDEKMLEQMATYFEMQLKLQEGMLNLKGHAGTGKDVLMKMFAHRTNRPYFAFDCTKWTTEADLSEDIVLESVNGASQTIYIPSAVVTAIQTPGAILYFNEWNAMPESAQVFMHSLLDEKRSMTLKTRSGKVVKADPSVLIASSMNPNYAGTFTPQMATRSRIVDLEVDYPPLLRDIDPGDTNPNKPYSVSEALKIAGSVPSLERSTIDRNMKHNEFVRSWDYEINGIGSPTSLSASQRFDMLVVHSLVQFGAKLREEFKKQYEGKGGRSKNSLPVNAPITLREMRRCGYMLGEMTEQEKATADPEKTAKSLIETFFLSHIDNTEDREKIVTAMGTWSAQKRIAA